MTTITTTVHLYPGTPRERLVKVEAAVSLSHGRYRIDRLNPLGGGVIGAHELGDAYDQIIEAARAHHQEGGIPEEERGGFTLWEVLIAVCFVAIFTVLAVPAFRKLTSVPVPPNPVVSVSEGTDVYLVTSRHDNHLFVTAWRGGILHHPDCPCAKTAPRAEVEQAKAPALTAP